MILTSHQQPSPSPEFLDFLRQKLSLSQNAINLGLDTCIECPGCKCGVGINLKGLVIKPLLEAAKNKNKKFIK